MHVATIGCGGIGSFFIGIVDKLIEGGQLDGMEFTCFDDDVVETKNIIYQNFEPGEVDDYKAEALSMRYLNIQNYVTQRVEGKDLNNYNLILICADNNKIRREVYELGIRFIDARSNGRTVGIYSSDTEKYLTTMSQSDESSSCQYPYAIEKNEIEVGNVIIASILSQTLLNYKRTRKLPPDFVYNF